MVDTLLYYYWLMYFLWLIICIIFHFTDERIEVALAPVAVSSIPQKVNRPTLKTLNDLLT